METLRLPRLLPLRHNPWVFSWIFHITMSEMKPVVGLDEYAVVARSSRHNTVSKVPRRDRVRRFYSTMISTCGTLLPRVMMTSKFSTCGDFAEWRRSIKGESRVVIETATALRITSRP